jgi:squalene-hopene/tetraprenyl-beta-curcumene cyclase
MIMTRCFHRIRAIRVIRGSPLWVLLAIPAFGAETGGSARIEAGLSGAASFLASRASSDGAWRSDSYGTFRDGLALTPLAAMALTYLQAYAASGAEVLDAASRFLVSAAGPCAEGERPMDYPVYSSSIAALALTMRPASPDAAPARTRWLRSLEEHQFSVSNGWNSCDAAFGGWGYTLHPPLRPSGSGAERYAANISATVFALAALRAAGVQAGDPRIQSARTFVERCQYWHGTDAEAEGGFFFSPCPAANNKAGSDELSHSRRYRPYGSATADGIRALVLCGARRNDARLQAAVRWLERNFRADANPGRFTSDSEVWRDGYYHYYAWSAAHALHLARAQGLGGGFATSGAWAPQLADALLDRQSGDGSWANRYTGGREDEPVIATSFAATALLLCRKNLTLPAAIPCPLVHGLPPVHIP